MRNFTAPENCDCYECVGAEYAWSGTYKYIVNDMKYHTFGEPCSKCGNPKSEYRDLGRKGYYTCWYCNSRAADTSEVSEPQPF